MVLILYKGLALCFWKLSLSVGWYEPSSNTQFIEPLWVCLPETASWSVQQFLAVYQHDHTDAQITLWDICSNRPVCTSFVWCCLKINSSITDSVNDCRCIIVECWSAGIWQSRSYDNASWYTHRSSCAWETSGWSSTRGLSASYSACYHPTSFVPTVEPSLLSSPVMQNSQLTCAALAQHCLFLIIYLKLSVHTNMQCIWSFVSVIAFTISAGCLEGRLFCKSNLSISPSGGRQLTANSISPETWPLKWK